MNYSKRYAINVIVYCLLALLFAACSGNGSGGNKTAASDSMAKAAGPKMSARERLAKNNILEKHNSAATQGLKGKVRSLSEMHYEISEKAGKEQKELVSQEGDFYDLKGNDTGNSYIYHTKNSKIEDKSLILLDANGNDTSSLYFGPGGRVLSRFVCKYDARGNEIESSIYDSTGKQKHRQTYKFDSKDNLTELASYNDNGIMNGSYTYTYDERGFVNAGQAFDSIGNLTFRQARKYDDQGNNLESTAYKMDGSIDYKYVSKYDDKGHRTESAEYGAKDSLISRSVMKYDANGHKTETIEYKPGGSIDDSKSAFYEYQYDSAGNIIKKTEFKMKDGKRVAVAIDEYTIVYY